MFEIQDVREMEVLHRALLEFKFGQTEPPEPYFGSPTLANVQNGLLDAIARTHQESGDARRAEQWRGFAQFGTRVLERDLVVRYLRQTPPGGFGEWDIARKREHIRVLIAPFRADDEEIDALLAEVAGG